MGTSAVTLHPEVVSIIVYSYDRMKTNLMRLGDMADLPRYKIYINVCSSIIRIKIVLGDSQLPHSLRPAPPPAEVRARPCIELIHISLYAEQISLSIHTIRERP